MACRIKEYDQEWRIEDVAPKDPITGIRKITTILFAASERVARDWAAENDVDIDRIVWEDGSFQYITTRGE